jgi:AcrR family transcriptional regulator
MSSGILYKKEEAGMESHSTTSSVRGVGRPRSESARQAILDAALYLARRDGFSALTIERIAREAGVGKPTIYRWWSSKGAIVFEALQQHAEQTIPIPVEGPLPARLTTFLRSVFTVLNEDTGEIVRSLMAEAQHDPAFAVIFRTQFINVRRKPLLALLQHGVASGELANDTNVDVLADLIYGAMWYRLLAQHAPLDAAFAHDIVQVLLHIPTASRDSSQKD